MLKKLPTRVSFLIYMVSGTLLAGSLFLTPFFQNQTPPKIVQTDNKVLEKKLDAAAKPLTPLTPLTPTVLAARSTPTRTPTPSPKPTVATSQTSKIYLGFALEPLSSSEITATKTEIKSDFSILMGYKQWGHASYPDIDLDYLNTFKSNGKTPFITWEPWIPGNGVSQPTYQLKKIASGNFDSYILKSAKYIKDFNSPLFLRFGHEMNGNWYPWGGTVNGNSAKDYIDAYRHIHELFRQQGVKNVTWVFSPDSTSFPTIKGNDLTDYYPGDSYVDWIGLDGYNWGTTRAGKTWQPFASVFSNAYTKMLRYNKPLMVAETSSTEQGGDKAQWIKEMFNSLASYPKIKAVIWFNINKETNWALDSSSSSLNQFSSLIVNPNYNQNLNFSYGKIVSP